MKKVITTIVLALSIGQAFADNKTASNKATATLSSSCQISVQSISFGSLILPLINQTASASMTVLCTKGTAYSIAMSTYSNIIMIASNTYGGTTGTTTMYNTNTNTVISKTAGFTYNAADLGYTSSQHGTTSSQCYGVYGECWVFKKPNVLTGASKGDTVAYYFQLPSNSTTEWNSSNVYSGTGTGTSQSISVVAQINPASSSPFPTPDSYSSTATSTISF